VKAPLCEQQIAEKMQKVSELQISLFNREQNCSRYGLFTNCSLLNPTMCVVLPDRGITKIAETVLVSAICGILPFCSVIRLVFVTLAYVV